MQHDPTSFDPIGFMQKVFMILGAVLFIALGGATLAQAGSPEAAHDTHDLQPELKATAVFSR